MPERLELRGMPELTVAAPEHIVTQNVLRVTA